jgi:hypothetical protein
MSFTAATREGFDPARLAAAERKFAATPGLVSVLAARHGRLAYERYYRGATGNQPQNVFSVTKSVTSTLVGIALSCAASINSSFPSFRTRWTATSTPTFERSPSAIS